MSMTQTADPYWSRLADRWEASPRQDPVVWSEQTEPLDADTIQAYDDQGFHYAQRLFHADEVQQWHAEAQRLIEVTQDQQRGVIREPGSQAVRSIFRIHRLSPVFRQVATDPRIVDVVRQMLGSDVYLHQSRINFKPAFDGKEFFWHSDFETWHMEDGMPRMRAVSVSIGLTENNEFNGSLMVVPSSHRTYVRCQGETPDQHYETSLKKQEYGVPSREAMAMLVEQNGIVAPKGPEGSALFFECNLMHGSSGNLSPFPRNNLFLVYNSVENGLVEPFGGQPPRPDYLAERDIIPIDELRDA